MRWLQDIVAKLSPGEPIYVAMYAAAIISSAFSTPRWCSTRKTSPGEPIYVAMYAAAIIFFCFFYTALVFNSKDTADNLKRSGAFIPGYSSR